MELLIAIHTRQSVAKVLPDPVPRQVIERLLDAAVQAPNHHRNRPWRFVVLTGPARQRLGQVMAQGRLSQAPDTTESVLEAERKKPLRAPVVIAVGIDKSDSEKIIEIENVCAGAAAVQNLLLAAHDLGLGAIWRTGTAASDPLVKAFLGFAAHQQLIAFVYVGYPDGERLLAGRPSFEDRVTWMED
ncbi:MAG TPA: nitroreductase [Anaerolineaceae bacterium]